MKNPTRIKFKFVSQEQQDKTVSAVVGVYGGSDGVTQVAPNTLVTFAGPDEAGKFTIELPNTFFERGGIADGAYRLGVRGIDSMGDEGGLLLSEPQSVVWEPLAFTDIEVE